MNKYSSHGVAQLQQSLRIPRRSGLTLAAGWPVLLLLACDAGTPEAQIRDAASGTGTTDPVRDGTPPPPGGKGTSFDASVGASDSGTMRDAGPSDGSVSTSDAMAADPGGVDWSKNQRLMLLGDSITAGYQLGVGGYRAQLRTRLQNANYQVTFVGSQGTYNPAAASGLEHEGHSGWTVPQITNIVQGAFGLNGTSADRILDAFRPDVVLLMIGTNDEIQKSGNATTDDYKALLDSIYAKLPNVRLLVAPFIHCSVFSDVQADNYNYGVRNLQFIDGATYETDRAGGVVGLVTGYQQVGRKISFVDAMHKAIPDGLSDNAWSQNDGVHPNATYYAIMGDIAFQALKNVSSTQAADTAPAVPTGLSATASGSSLNLVWTRNSGNETRFEVDATTDPLFKSGIMTFNAGAGSNKSTIALQPKRTYYLRIRALNGSGASANSYPYRATTEG
jgi:lysophospholipase L1-like esterase